MTLNITTWNAITSLCLHNFYQITSLNNKLSNVASCMNFV